MNSQTTKFISKKTVAFGTVEFDFGKPADFSFTAGQYLVWKISNLSPTDEKGDHRDFTISAPPYEKYLSFTTRLRDSAFKNRVQKMQPGDEIEFAGPFGDLILSNSPINQSTNQPAVFLAGGIGITPFRSISLQESHDRSPQKITLFHFDKSPEDMPYFAEMQNLEKSNPNFKYVPILTKPVSGWTGETGHLTTDLLKKYLDPSNPLGTSLNSYLYLVAGPPAMVEAIRGTLVDEAKISVDNIFGENFGGY